MDIKYFPAIFEGGKLLPLEPLHLDEHERVEVAIFRTATDGEGSEEDYIPSFIGEADAKVTLEQVQQALAKIPGSVVDDFDRERDERF